MTIEKKKRHWCLTMWLVLMIVANFITALTYRHGSDAIRRAVPNIPDWAFIVLIVLSLFNFVCSIALFKWKKWGFWGLFGSCIVGLAVNFSIGVSIGKILAGLIGMLLLYGAFNIGKENMGWHQLE